MTVMLSVSNGAPERCTDSGLRCATATFTDRFQRVGPLLMLSGIV